MSSEPRLVMRVGGISELPLTITTKLFAEAVVRVEMSRAAKIVMVGALTEIKYSLQEPADRAWETNLRMRARFSDREDNEAFDVQMYFTLPDQTTAQSSAPMPEMVVHFMRRFMQEIVHDKQTLPKLALLYADDIADMAEIVAEQNDYFFDPGAWATRVREDFLTNMTIREIGKGGDFSISPNALCDPKVILANRAEKAVAELSTHGLRFKLRESR